MNKFNLLIIGNASHQYIINFAKWLKVAIPDIYISIISTNFVTKVDLKKAPYDELYIGLNNTNFISRIKGFRTLYRAWNTYRIIQTKGLGTNTILIHYAETWLALVCKRIKLKTRNFSVALWGSDFYKVRNKRKLNKILNQANNIIIGTPQMLDDFKIEFTKYIQKVHLCYFGNEPIEHINLFRETKVTRKQSCVFFKLSNDKLNVSIGHNGSIVHQHTQILNEMLKLDPEAKSKIRIILPMTYGLSPEYLEAVKRACERTAIDFYIFTEFMTEIDVAHLRNLTDIMINLQTTDAFSGSMREVLYCGGVVINGSWLPYRFLKELGIYFEEVDSIPEIPEKLTRIVNNYYFFKEQCKNNPSKIFGISSWSQVISQWKEVLELQL